MLGFDDLVETARQTDELMGLLERTRPAVIAATSQAANTQNETPNLAPATAAAVA